MIEIPEQIYIGSVWWDVERVSVIKGKYGECDTVARVIRITEGLDDEQLLMTFLHECFHAVDELYELNLGETGVRILENCTYQIMEQIVSESQ